jgi:hypothetical protein
MYLLPGHPCAFAHNPYPRNMPLLPRAALFPRTRAPFSLLVHSATVLLSTIASVSSTYLAVHEPYLAVYEWFLSLIFVGLARLSAVP